MSLIGAAVGVLLASWVTSIVDVAQLPAPISRSRSILKIDARVLLFTTGAALLAALLAGLAPAVQASRPNLVADLRGDRPMARAGRRWTLRDVLVAGQMAVTAILLVVAALLTRTLVAAQRTQRRLPGREARGRVHRHDDGADTRRSGAAQFFDDAVARLKTIPGVEAAALATRVPFSINYNRWDVWIPDRHQPGEHGDVVDMTSVSPDYFETMGVPHRRRPGIHERRPAEHAVGGDRQRNVRPPVLAEPERRRQDVPIARIGRPRLPNRRCGRGPQGAHASASRRRRFCTSRRSSGRAATPRSSPARAATRPTLLREMRRELLALEPNLVFVENQTMEAEVSTTLFPVRAGAWVVSGVGVHRDDAGRDRAVRRDRLFGRAAHARNRHPHGARRAAGDRSSASSCSRACSWRSPASRPDACWPRRRRGLIAQARSTAFAPSDPVSWFAAIIVVLGVSALANFIPAWRAARVDPSHSAADRIVAELLRPRNHETRKASLGFVLSCFRGKPEPHRHQPRLCTYVE